MKPKVLELTYTTVLLCWVSAACENKTELEELNTELQQCLLEASTEVAKSFSLLMPVQSNSRTQSINCYRCVWAHPQGWKAVLISELDFH